MSAPTAGRRSPRSSCRPTPTGFVVEPAYDKLGWHACDTHPLTFTDARVPEDHLLGERGRGFAQFLATLDDGRVAIAALAVGCIQACLEMSTAVRQRAHHVLGADRQPSRGWRSRSPTCR